MKGGIESGYAQMGLLQLNMDADTDKMNWWKNGMWKIQLQSTYGHQPTDNLTGDAQVFSNIEHGNYTYLYQFWYRHELGRTNLLLGKHDMNTLFFTSDYAGNYINSSFGIMPVASLNVPVSIFPSTTLGTAISYSFTPELKIRGGVYNGFPGKITRTNLGTDLNLHPSRGLFYIGEAQWETEFMKMPGKYKMGLFYHGGTFANRCNPQVSHTGASGFYLLIDQALSMNTKEQTRLGSFLQLGHSPDPCSLNDFYLALGFHYHAPWGMDHDNSLGVGLAHASTNDRLEDRNADYQRCETAIELTYKHHLGEHLVVQPDLQYILNPGMKTATQNCLVGMIRMNWTYQ